MVVTVTDAGPGVDDPLLGLVRAGPTGQGDAGGYGLWFAGQLCTEVALARTPAGFTARLVAGRPRPQG
jgi:anti-sigma regulatory factor (Ser/Thr protein kinase)